MVDVKQDNNSKVDVKQDNNSKIDVSQDDNSIVDNNIFIWKDNIKI